MLFPYHLLWFYCHAAPCVLSCCSTSLIQQVPLKDRLCALYQQTTDGDTGPWSLLRGLTDSLGGLVNSNSVSVDGQRWKMTEEEEWRYTEWERWKKTQTQTWEEKWDKGIWINGPLPVEKTTGCPGKTNIQSQTSRRRHSYKTGERWRRRHTNTAWYLHSNTKVHHGHAGVAMPADVHGGVTTLTLALQRRARAAELLLRLLLGSTIFYQLWGTTGRWKTRVSTG